MPTTHQTQILIVGAGPVGLTLATDLAQRGINVIVAELRNPREAPRVKCNHISARSMEIFRRLGVSARLRNAGLPEEHANDASFRTTVTGLEIGRIPIPCRRDRYTATGGPDTWWPTPEPPHRINQHYMEPILYDHAASHANITFLNRTQIDSFTQNESAVTAHAINLDSGDSLTIHADYLIGCDGGSSPTRKAIGATFIGDAVVQRVQSTWIRAPGLHDLMQVEPAWATIALNPRRSGTLYAIDGKESWIVHNYLKPEETDFDAIDRDWSIRTILGVDADFKYDIISNEDWVGRRLVADKFRERRVFICGDAAHIWVPYAGYGMNAGIADAANLAWLLAATVNGWASPAILDAYEAERLPITEQVSVFAMNHAHGMIKNRKAIPANIEDPSPAGDALRAAYGKELYDFNVQQYCCGGLNFGSYYDKSPIIAYNGEPHPPYSMADFTESTIPGCRLPHFFMENGVPLYDILGQGYTLIRLDPRVQVDAFMASAATAGLPITLLDIDKAVAPPTYTHALTLTRPDQHVAWRSNQSPEHSDQLINLLTGKTHPVPL